MFLNYAVGDRKTQAGTLADFLGRVERLEYPRQRIEWNAIPSIPTETTTSPWRAAVVISIRPGRPAVASACSAFMTMLRNT